jgi:large subunit ribosomal protein L4
MIINCFDISGKKLTGITVSSQVFGQKANDALLSQAIRVYLSNQRRANAKAKSRSEITGSRRKIWRQKGTGRARHSDRYAPIFVGGGVAHGPKGDQNFNLKLTSKMRRQALKLALSAKCGDGKLVAVKGLDKIPPKTKEFAKILTALKLNDRKIAFVLSKKQPLIERSVSNLANSKALLVNLLNPYRVLFYDVLVFEPEALLFWEDKKLIKSKTRTKIKTK